MLSLLELTYNVHMTVLLWIIFVFVVGGLLLVASIRPYRSRISIFELNRRSQLGSKDAVNDLMRINHYDDVVALLRVAATILLVISIFFSITLLGWFVGVIVAVFIAIEYPVLARIPLIRHYGEKIYSRIELHLVRFTNKFSRLFVIFRDKTTSEESPEINSREELQHIISESSDILTSDEKRLLTHSLSFGTRHVSEVMTPRSVIDTVEGKELLGPLALDELHKTGHSRFPVIEGDIDHIVGILHVQDLLTISHKKSQSAAQAMESRVFYIREDQSLQHALSAFIRTHHHLFIVVNQYRETVGIVSLEDVIEALIGRKIIDEFDAHDDLRAVAARNPRANNQPQKHTDV